MTLNIRQILRSIYDHRVRVLRTGAGVLVVIAYGVVMAMTARRALTEAPPVPSRSRGPFAATMEPIDAGRGPGPALGPADKGGSGRMTTAHTNLHRFAGWMMVEGGREQFDAAERIAADTAKAACNQRESSKVSDTPCDLLLWDESRFGENPADAMHHPWPHTGEVISWPTVRGQRCGPGGSVVQAAL